MNYWPRWINAIRKRTASLSLAQMGAYDRLLDHYYAEEQPLPGTLDECCRIAGAIDKTEREAVRFVLAKFFTLGEDGYSNERADDEIAIAKPKIEAARKNGATGGRPRKNPTGTEQKPTGFPAGTHDEPTPKAPQSKREEVSDEPIGSSSSPEATGKPRSTVPCPYAEIVGLYHEALPTLPRCRLMPAGRQKALRKVWAWVLSSAKADGTRRATNADEALAWFKAYFERAASNDFLLGRGPRSAEHANWTADLDFLMTDRGMKHVIEKTQEAA